jgi:hypothetical protein
LKTTISLLPFQRRELATLLPQAGLSEIKAEIFIANATFREGKFDLYDAPLIVSNDGTLWLLTPLLRSALVWSLVTSQLGSLKTQIHSKGRTFEKKVLSLFDHCGLEARSFSFQANGRQYQCDAAVLWQDHLFIFECKHYSLPSDSPADSYYFWLKCAQAVEQVKRIGKDLMDQPEIVKKHFGEQAQWSHVHCCVLNAMPFSLGQIDDVFVYDEQALSRFLIDGSVGFKWDAPQDRDAGPATARLVTRRLWTGSRPTPQDLLAEMGHPSQVAFYQKQLEVQHLFVALSPRLALSSPAIRKKSLSMTDFLESAGASTADVSALFAALRTAVPSDVEDE